MARYRKRPIIIDALRFDGTNHEEIEEWADECIFEAVDPEERGDDPEITAQVWDKLHNTWVGVKDGQWIIRGIQNEHYPCDEDVFAATYEPVSDNQSLRPIPAHSGTCAPVDPKYDWLNPDPAFGRQEMDAEILDEIAVDE